MRIQAGIIVVSLLALAAGCDKSVSTAPAGAPPEVKIPVGPIPGPGKEAFMLPTNPYEGNTVAVTEGRRLFLWYNCYGCHGGHGGGGMGPSLRDPTWLYGSAPAHIFASVAEGRAHGMPAWGTKVPEDQIWKLVAYIESMRTDHEPDPPVVTPEPEVKEANARTGK